MQELHPCHQAALAVPEGADVEGADADSAALLGWIHWTGFAPTHQLLVQQRAQEIAPWETVPVPVAGDVVVDAEQDGQQHLQHDQAGVRR